MNGLRARVGPLLAVVWLSVLVVAYLIVQPPLDARTALALGSRLWDVASVAVLVTFGGALGGWLMPDLPDLGAAERAAVAALAGLAILSVGVLALGLIGWYPPRWLAEVLTIGGLVALYRPGLRWLSEIREALLAGFAPLDDRLMRWLRRAVVGMLALAVMLALLPPTTWDALVYHLTIPRTYLAAGRIVAVPENHHSGFPQLVEQLYLWLMLVASPQAAGLLHAAFGWLLALLVLGLAQRVGRPGAGWLALAALLASPSIWGEYHWPYADLALMAYTLAAVILLLLDGNGRTLAWGGALIGCMMATKYSAAPYVIGLGLMVLWLSWKSGWGDVLRAILIVAGAALLVFSPWLLKNWFVDGNPISPFVFGTAAFDDLDAWYYLRAGTGLRPLEVLFYPMQASVFGREGGTLQSAAGPLVFGLLPLVVVGWQRRDVLTRRVLSSLLVVIAVGYTWFVTGIAVSWFLAQTRLLFPVFPMLALTGAIGLHDLAANQRWVVPARLARLIFGVMVAGAALVSAVEVVRVNPLPVLAGVESKDDYLLGRLQAYYLTMLKVNELPAEAQVLFLWEPRSYYCQRVCVPDTLINRWWHDQQTIGDPDAILRRWQEQGYTHLLVFESGGRFLIEQEPYDPMTEADWEALIGLLDRLKPVWTDLPSYGLYSLETAP